MINVLIIAAVLWFGFLALAFGSLYLSNRLEDRTVYECPVSHWIVIPADTFDCGYNIEAWVCVACDACGNDRRDAGYNPAIPGIHYRNVVAQAAPPEWRPRRRSV